MSQAAVNQLLGTAVVLATAIALASLAMGLLLARRYRQLRDGLVATGVLSARPDTAARAAGTGGTWLPAPGTPVPADLTMSTVTGASIGAADFSGADVVMAFLTSPCTTCRAELGGLCTALATIPASAPKPIVVLNGDPDDWPQYVAEVSDLARLVVDRDPPKGHGVADVLGVHSYPAVLVVGGGVVRRAGMRASDVELVPA